MKKIGLIDYYLDEYHAHVAFKSIGDLNTELGTDFAITAAYAEKDSDGGLTTAQFCEKHGIESKASIAELCSEVDYIIILSPDDNDKKEGYAIEAIKAGKPIFMDKTFTDTYASACRIFDAADKAGVPLFSSSSLRYADELKSYKKNSTSVLVLGSGVTMDKYAVHYLEIIISCMGVGIKTVRHEQRGEQEWVHIGYSDGRQATAVISMGDYLDFRVFLADSCGKTRNFEILSPIFKLQMADVLRFFETKEVSFDRAETLELMKTLDAILESKENMGKCVEL